VGFGTTIRMSVPANAATGVPSGLPNQASNDASVSGIESDPQDQG
jgi:hypothetical protein